MLALPLFCVCTSLLPVRPGPVLQQARLEPQIEAVAQLRDWLERFRRQRELSPDAELALRQRIDSLELLAQAEPEHLPVVLEALLDVAGFELGRKPAAADFSGGSAVSWIRGNGLRALRGLLEGPQADGVLAFLTDEVLVLGRQHPPGRRFIAFHLLEDQRTDDVRMAFLTIGRNPDDELRPDVLWTLAGWPEESVDLFLVGLIGRKLDRVRKPHPFNILLERVRDVGVPLSERATDMLQRRLAYMLISSDWRDASRAIELSRGLGVERAIPLLLDALTTWHRRSERGDGSRKLLDEIARELRRISGRSIGNNPRNWVTWWIAVRQGRVSVAGGDLEDGEHTKATFFGLRPVSDRVTFVIDYSGSMRTGWGTEGHSRYQEAIEQMVRFLQASGEATRFNVILFSDEPLRSSPELVAADADTIERARSSLLRREPDGGTCLLPAIELALRVDPTGQFDQDRLEADTIVVLCDGETGEGSAWVDPLLDRVQAEARVVFHCVLIGTRGDGTLERLAERTNGDFIRVGG